MWYKQNIIGAKFSSRPSYFKIDIFSFRLWCLTFTFVDIIGSLVIDIEIKWSYLPPIRKKYVGTGHQCQCSLLYNDTFFSIYWPKYDYCWVFLSTRKWFEPLPGPSVCIKKWLHTPEDSWGSSLRASNLNFWIRKQTFSSVLGLIKHKSWRNFELFLIIVIVLSPGIQITHVIRQIRTFFPLQSLRQLPHLETFGD